MPHDISIVIITICRESLLRAISSIYQQTYTGRIQILIGVDVDAYGLENSVKKAILDECPENIDVTWINPGYSTSVRHGGVHACHFGGSLRVALTYLANSKFVMYLDDDDWLKPNHCCEILSVIGDNYWAFSYSIYADGNLTQEVCIDLIESIGVNRGVYAENFGGFVRPSGMLINKMKVSNIVHQWCESPYVTGDGEDRLVFDKLKKLDHVCTNNATVCYSLDPRDGMHSIRMTYMKSQGVIHQFRSKAESVR